MFIVFTFNAQIETWYSNIKQLVKFKAVKVVKSIRYTASYIELKRKTQNKWFYLFLSCCVILKRQVQVLHPNFSYS